MNIYTYTIFDTQKYTKKKSQINRKFPAAFCFTSEKQGQRQNSYEK